MAARPQTWPQATDELLPKTLFKLAERYPDLTYSEYPRNPTSAADGYQKITYREVANAVHAVAWWIEQNLGRPPKDDGSNTIVYLGPNDLSYGVLVLASVMVGYKMLFPTPRYGAEAMTRLIAAVDGNIMLKPSLPFPVVAEVLAMRPMRTFDLPSIDHFLSALPQPFPYTKTFESSKDEPLVCLHTSGTTGFPKPIIWTHDWLNSLATGYLLTPPPGFERVDKIFLGPQKRMLTLFPPFHASGIICALFFQLLFGTTVVFGPGAPSPGRAMDEMAEALDVLGKQGSVDLLALPPPHVEYLGANTTLLERVSQQVSLLLYGGGDISHAAGEVVTQKMHIFNQLASTEMGLWTALRSSNDTKTREVGDEWHYNIFDPSLNMRFIEVSEDLGGKKYEAVMVKSSDANAWIQPIFKVYNDREEISLGDLFTQHPYNQNKWKHYGRADDLLNFLSAETFHPGAAERHISAYPGVVEALIVGQQRPKASLILRLRKGADVEGLWSVIEGVNRNVPVYARVEKHMILEIDAPFERTAKGTVQKRAVVDMYTEELDALYQRDSSHVPST